MIFTKKQAFTLVEVVIVVLVIGILAAIALPKFIDLSYKATVRSEQRVMLEMLGAINLNHAKTYADTGIDRWYQDDPLGLLSFVPTGWRTSDVLGGGGDVAYIFCPHCTNLNIDTPGPGATILYRRSKTTPSYLPEVEPGQVWLFQDRHGGTGNSGYMPDYMPVDRWQPD